MDLNWSQLGFSYTKTEFNVRATYQNGKWGDLEIFESDKLDISIASTALHYGQQCFEGMKAFAGNDGKVRLFRPEENSKRLNDSAERLLMPTVPENMFIEAIEKAIRYNKEYIPPYGSGASLYIRPLLIGSGETIGVQPSPEYTFIVFVMPVGPYFKEGFQTTKVLVEKDTDRAAPLGTGSVKVGGNYAASLIAGKKAKAKGYSTILYLDAKEKKYIDECGPANFFMIKEGTYFTPKSESILPSITNKSLMVLAEEIGLKTERRKLELSDLEGAQEAGACGTAAVISPISQIDDEQNGKSYKFSTEPGEICTKLYTKLQAIQNGDEEDKFGWNHTIEF